MYKSKINGYYSSFKSEFGDKRFRLIHNDMYTSKKVSRLIKDCLDQKLFLSADSYIRCVMSHITYTFASADKVLLASLIVYERWINEVNIINKSLNDSELNFYLDKIIGSVNEMRFR